MNARSTPRLANDAHPFPREPQEWFLISDAVPEARSTWPQIPFKVFAEWLKRRPDWVVADFGCGEAELARLIPNKLYSFDHVAVNESVIVCDMVATGLADQTLDVAVFSLSLTRRSTIRIISARPIAFCGTAVGSKSSNPPLAGRMAIDQT